MLFLQLGQVGSQPHFQNLYNVLLPAPVRHKGISVVKPVIPGAGIRRALPAKRDPAVLDGAPSYGAALVARSTAAAGAVAALPHGTQGAVEPAERKSSFCTGKAFHLILLIGCRMTVFSRSGLQHSPQNPDKTPYRALLQSRCAKAAVRFPNCSRSSSGFSRSALLWHERTSLFADTSPAVPARPAGR